MGFNNATQWAQRSWVNFAVRIKTSSQSQDSKHPKKGRRNWFWWVFRKQQQEPGQRNACDQQKARWTVCAWTSKWPAWPGALWLCWTSWFGELPWSLLKLSKSAEHAESQFQFLSFLCNSHVQLWWCFFSPHVSWVVKMFFLASWTNWPESWWLFELQDQWNKEGRFTLSSSLQKAKGENCFGLLSVTSPLFKQHHGHSEMQECFSVQVF